MKTNLALLSLCLMAGVIVTGCSSSQTKREIASASFTISTYGDDHRLGNNSADQASDCGGSIAVKGNDDRNLSVVFSGVDQCKSAELRNSNGQKIKDWDLEGNQGSYRGSFSTNLSELNDGSVFVFSGSKSHNNTVRFRLIARNVQNAHGSVDLDHWGDKGTLPACGGTVKMTKSAQGTTGSEQVNIVFSKVKNCDVFDILKENGERISYSQNTIPADSNGTYSGSRTLPNEMTDTFGREKVKLVIRNSSSSISDTIITHYVVVSADPAPAPRPAPNYDNSSGDGY